MHSTALGVEMSALEYTKDDKNQKETADEAYSIVGWSI